MNRYLRFLVDLYVDHSINEIDNNPSLLQTAKKVYKQNGSAKNFDDDSLIVRKLKEHIEFINDTFEVSVQATECLAVHKKICDEFNFKENEIFEALVRGFFFKRNWNDFDDIKGYYDKTFPIICKWKYFFFSYTNRNAKQTNEDFKHCLLDSYNNEENQLAAFIVQTLLGHNLTGFWDYDDINIGNEIKQEIIQNCKEVFCFVQLIEQKIFYDPKKGTNWCHLEYLEFKKNPLLRLVPVPITNCMLLFIVQDDRALNIANPGSYLDWLEEVKDRKYLHFDQNKVCYKIRKDIDTLANHIYETREKIIDHLLN